MTDLIDTVQKTALDDAFIELFDVELKYKNSSNVIVTELIHLIDGLELDGSNLWMPYESSPGTFIWAEYLACPIAIEGISVDSTGAASRPTLSIANIASMARSISGYPYPSSPSLRTDSDGLENETNIDDILKDLQIVKNEDVLGSIITYRKTLLKNTFVKSTDTTVTPNVNRWYAQDHPTKNGSSGVTYIVSNAPAPIEFPEQKFVLDRVATETNLLVSFELANPLDVQGLQIPNRYVIGKYCPWAYKGAVAGSTKSGCPWKNNGMRTVTINTTTDATEGTYGINYSSLGISYSGTSSDNITPADWALTVTVNSSGVASVAINNPGHSFEENETITIPSSIIGGTTALVVTVATRMNFDIDDNYVADPANDVCGKSLASCKIRFHPKYAGTLSTNTDIALPFGGFPGSRKFK